MPNYTRRKPFSGRRGRDSLPGHWLEEGADGQEALFFDLDPSLLAIDQALCSRVTQFAFRVRDKRKQPRALLIPPAGTVYWHGAFFSRQFEVYSLMTERDELADLAAQKFGATLIESLEDLPDQSADLVVFLDSSWSELRSFKQGLYQATEFLAEDGELLSVMACSLVEQGPQIIWCNAEPSPLDAIASEPSINNYAFLGYHVELLTPGLFNSLASSFLKRHREFFGKNARELFLQRINDPDFCLSPATDGAPAVSLLSWGDASAPGLSR